MIETRKREHSRKPDELYPIIEACSPGPFLELFVRRENAQPDFFSRGQRRPRWTYWGAEAGDDHDATASAGNSLAAEAPSS